MSVCSDGPAPLFDSYPLQPGVKAGAPETSRISAARVAADASLLRQQCLNVLGRHPGGLTADEVAAALGESVLSIRPRMSELRRLGEIADTGDRRRNASGHTAAVWLVPVVPKQTPNKSLFEDVAVTSGASLRAIRGR